MIVKPPKIVKIYAHNVMAFFKAGSSFGEKDTKERFSAVGEEIKAHVK